MSTLVLQILQSKRTIDKPILVYIITSGAANAPYDAQHLAAVIQVRVSRSVSNGSCVLCGCAQGMQQMMRDFRLPAECISFQLLQVAQDPVATSTFSQLDAQFSNCVDTTGP